MVYGRYAPHVRAKPAQMRRSPPLIVKSIYSCPPPNWIKRPHRFIWKRNEANQSLFTSGMRPNRWCYKFYNFLMSATKMRAIFIFRENAFRSFFIRSGTLLAWMKIKIHGTQRLLDAGYNMLLLCWDLVWRRNICCCFLERRDKFMFWLKSAKWWTKRCLVEKITSPTFALLQDQSLDKSYLCFISAVK